jgi:epoxyqueuosine reductase
VARAEPLEKEGEFLRIWLAQGRHADMTWLADRPERRIDPARVLSDCRSVIVVGANYHRPGVSEETQRDDGSPRKPEGRIAQYAQRVDYHRTLGRRVRNLARRIVGELGGQAAARPYVDTGPVLEKAWAQRAGLGFIGKNTCLIHPKRGSWFLLGTILTSVELEADAPVPEGCGACRRCLDACPTGALVEPGVLDSGRCLSYLTIEHRGEKIEEHWKPFFQEWLFGCDVCQEVCPYNRKFEARSDEGGILGRYLHPPTIPVEEILALESEEAALERFGRRSPLRRAGLRGLQRTACLVRNAYSRLTSESDSRKQ